MRLPITAPKLGSERYLELMRVDKKADGGTIRYITLEKLGKAKIEAVPDQLVTETLNAYQNN